MSARVKDNGRRAMDANAKQIASSKVMPWPRPHSRHDRRLPAFVAVKLVEIYRLVRCPTVVPQLSTYEDVVLKDMSA